MTTRGKLTFVKVKFLGDTGAYASVGMKVLERSAGHATGAYNVPVTDVEATAVYTNNVPCGAMRGFGVNQAIFGLESLIDDLCEQGGFDRWQFRYDNALQNGDMTATGQIIEGGAGARETLLAVKDAFYAAKYAGLACGLKNTGIGNGMPDESAVLDHHCRAGQRHHRPRLDGDGPGRQYRSPLQVVCNETGIDPRIIEVRIDTAAEQDGGHDDRLARHLAGGQCADRRLQRSWKPIWKPHSLADLVGKKYRGEWIADWTTKPGAMVEKVYTHYSYSYATQLVTLDDDGQIEKITAAHDAGKIFNPTLFEGQLGRFAAHGIGLCD